MNYNLMPLKYFVDVVQTHGFISAAKRNFVSETAVSSAISKLEKEVGAELIDRSANHFALTIAGEVLYERAIKIIYSYDEILHHLSQQPQKNMLRVHFLEGFGKDTVQFAQLIPQDYNLSFDQEDFSNSISRLLNHDYDLLIGFELAFIHNAKLSYKLLHKIDFKLLFNKKELINTTPKQLAAQSILFLQYWQSTGISDVQTKMIEKYSQNGWTFKKAIGVNSFTAAALNVNFTGGFTMVPDTFKLPSNCQNISVYSPKHLKNAFHVVAAYDKFNQKVEEIINKAIS